MTDVWWTSQCPPCKLLCWATSHWLTSHLSTVTMLLSSLQNTQRTCTHAPSHSDARAHAHTQTHRHVLGSGGVRSLFGFVHSSVLHMHICSLVRVRSGLLLKCRTHTSSTSKTKIWTLVTMVDCCHRQPAVCFKDWVIAIHAYTSKWARALVTSDEQQRCHLIIA